MKKLLPLLLLCVIALSLGWYILRTPARDAHYDAAACAALVVLGPPTNQQDFDDKLRTVILSENNSWSLKQVTYQPRLGQLSIARYQRLSAEQKAAAAQDVDSCIKAMQTQ